MCNLVSQGFFETVLESHSLTLLFVSGLLKQMQDFTISFSHYVKTRHTWNQSLVHAYRRGGLGGGFTCTLVLCSKQACEGVLLAGSTVVTAFINHRFTSAGPDLSHGGREVPDVSWWCLL